MSRLIHVINVWNQSKMISSQVHEYMMIFDTDRTKPLRNNKSTKRYGCR